LPNLNGFALAGWLRNEPKLAGAIILMLSSNDRMQYPDQCKDPGRVWVDKPISRSSLLHAITKALGLLPASPTINPAAAAPARTARPTRPLRILLAEDTPANQKLVQHVLGSRGHHITVARNGREALRELEQHPFDLVLMDVQMPDMDGLEAAAAIRDREARATGGDWVPAAGSSFAAGGRIPIVAVTAHAMQGDEERCLAAGMDGYVTKPIQPAELTSAIERLLPLETLPASTAVEHPLPRETLPSSRPASPPVDLEAARRLAAGDEDLRAEVAAMFIEGCRRHQAELRDAVQAADPVRIGQIAHALKGASGAVGATTAQALAGEVEALSRDGCDDRLATLASELDRELGRASDFLAAQSSVESA
jgi:CheY-like chemotaxis protein/HPt (histidine-containing phosphotransfer) domain-containing protein